MIEVCAAVIRHHNKILLTTRPEGKHLAGQWEFPGGKLEPNETHQQCLKREIKEEINGLISLFDSIYRIRYSYSDRDVILYFYRAVLNNKDEITPCEGQELKWFSLSELSDLPIVAADLPFIQFLQMGEGK